MNKKKVLIASTLVFLLLLSIIPTVLGASWLRERKSLHQLQKEKQMKELEDKEKRDSDIISARRIIGWYKKLPKIFQGVYYKSVGSKVYDTHKVVEKDRVEPFAERELERNPIREHARVRQNRGRVTPPSITGAIVGPPAEPEKRPLRSARRTLGTADAEQNDYNKKRGGKYYRREYPKQGELGDKTFVRLFE